MRAVSLEFLGQYFRNKARMMVSGPFIMKQGANLKKV